MAGKANDPAHLRITANLLNKRLADLEATRTKAKSLIDTSAEHFKADSANQYHTIMYEWDLQFDKVTHALAKAINALGGSAQAMEHAEEDNKTWAGKFSGSAQSLNLPI